MCREIERLISPRALVAQHCGPNVKSLNRYHRGCMGFGDSIRLRGITTRIKADQAVRKLCS